MNSSRVDRRRRYSVEMKARILSACDEPGASVAQIALEHGLNANLVHKWRRKAASDGGWVVKPTSVAVPINDFVAVPVQPVSDIRVAVRRGQTVIEVHWPASAAEACAQLLARLLR